MTVDPTGRWLAVGHRQSSWNKVDSFWILDLENFQVERTFGYPSTTACTRASFSPAGDVLAAGVGNEAWRWKVATGELV